MKKLSVDKYIPYIALLAIAAYVVFWFLGKQDAGNYVTLFFLGVGSLPLVWDMLKKMARKQFGVDIIAIIAIVTSITLGQYLAGSVILLMLSGGEALESYALGRARRELTSLLGRAPTVAHVKNGQNINDKPIEQVLVGDIVVVKPGEIIPVDGIVTSGVSLVDESAITGESLPAEVTVSSRVLSGGVCTSGILEIKTIKESKDSKYQQLVRLVKMAEENKAPIVRLADRYTVIFTVTTFAMALLAWLLSGQAIRVLAVLVVATPCPLILATPIAIISGISKAAKRGIIVKDGGALENLGEAKAFVFDKTGTITLGLPEVFKTDALEGTEDGILKIAGSLDQLSAHILARSLLEHIRAKQIAVAYPADYKEFFGDGVSGVLGKKYFFGKLSFLEKNSVQIPEKIKLEHEQLQKQGVIAVYLGDEQKLLGVVFFRDIIRPESKKVFSQLRNSGIKKIVMLTGDRKEVAMEISKQLGLKDVLAEYLPEQKMQEIKNLQHQGYTPLIMVGDGINDAAALATADVGIAMGAHGSSASSETADIVITVDNLARVAEGFSIARRMMRIALEGIWVGMGLSLFLMVLAALGHIQPVPGALMQEVIDVLVILNALRVLL